MVKTRRVVAVRYDSDFAAASAIEEQELVQCVEPACVLVQVVFAGVNAGYDTLACEGRLDFLPGSTPEARSPRPWDLGVEATGIVTLVGSEVENVRPGDFVACVKLGAGYREHVVVSQADLVKVPALTREIVSLLPSAYSALLGLELIAEIKSGDVIFVTAGAGALGGYTVQLAKMAGCHVIATCGSPDKEKYLRSIGCDRIIQYKDEDTDTVLSTSYPHGVDIAFDAVGGAMFGVCVRHIAIGGRVVVAGAFGEYGARSSAKESPAEYSRGLNTHLMFRSASVRGFVMSHFSEKIPEFRERVIDLWKSGRLRAQIDGRSGEFVGLESIASAVAHQREGANIGKVVVTIHPLLGSTVEE